MKDKKLQSSNRAFRIRILYDLVWNVNQLKLSVEDKWWNSSFIFSGHSSAWI